MEMSRSVKVGIITSLTATFLFIYFLDPILILLGSIIVEVSSRVYSAYLDRLFMQASLGVTHDPAFFVLMSIYGFAIGAPVGMITVVTMMKRKSKIDKKEGAEKPKRSGKKIVILMVIIWSAMYITLFMSLWSLWFQLKITSSFEQHMKTVAPYLEEDEEEIIWSKWTQMKSEKDYNAIYKRLKDIAAENSVELPPNPVYTIKSL